MPQYNGQGDRYYRRLEQIQANRDAGTRSAMNAHMTTQEYNARSSYLNMLDVYAKNKSIQQRNAIRTNAHEHRKSAQQRDAQNQVYTQQNMTQRETFNVSAKWQEQIQQFRNAGMDFSQKQQNEIKMMEEAFRKNVLNNPNLDEGLKQQAMLEHQRKLSAIVPNERVQNPQEGLNQSLIFHEPTKSWFMQGRDSRGFPTWQPLGGGGSGKQVDPEKQAEEQRKNMLKREETLIKLDEEIRSKIDPETGTLKFTDEDEIDEEKLRRLAPYEQFYTDPTSPSSLPPHELYQIKAQRDQLKQIKDAKSVNMGDSLRLRSGDPASQTAYETNPPQQMPGQTSSGPWPVASEMDALEGKPKAEPLVLPPRKPLSNDISKKLRDIPGGEELYNVREKHKSNSKEDQYIRTAADVVITALLTGDKSDPLLPEALDILKQLKRGYSIDGQNTPAILDVGSPAF